MIILALQYRTKMLRKFDHLIPIYNRTDAVLRTTEFELIQLNYIISFSNSWSELLRIVSNLV